LIVLALAGDSTTTTGMVILPKEATLVTGQNVVGRAGLSMQHL
jgi:hypothetical protein